MGDVSTEFENAEQTPNLYKRYFKVKQESPLPLLGRFGFTRTVTLGFNKPTILKGDLFREIAEELEAEFSSFTVDVETGFKTLNQRIPNDDTLISDVYLRGSAGEIRVYADMPGGTFSYTIFIRTTPGDGVSREEYAAFVDRVRTTVSTYFEDTNYILEE